MLYITIGENLLTSIRFWQSMQKGPLIEFDDFEVLCILHLRCQELQRGVNVFHTAAKLHFALCFVVFAAISVHYKCSQIAINAELPTNPASIKLVCKSRTKKLWSGRRELRKIWPSKSINKVYYFRRDLGLYLSTSLE